MGKTIAIFGVGIGLGLSVAKKFAKEGYEIALVGRTKSKLNTYVTEVKEAVGDVKLKTYIADLTHFDQINKAIDEIIRDFGKIDVAFSSPLVLDAFSPAASLTVEFAKTLVDLFYYSAITIVQRLLPSFIERRGGAFLFGTGISSTETMPGLSGLGPAQAALRNYLLTLQKEVADKGVQVGILSIGVLITGSAGGKASDEKHLPEDIKRIHADDIALDVWDIFTKKEVERVLS